MSKEKEKYPEFRWRALSRERQDELRILLAPLHLEELFVGSASLDDAINMVRQAIEETRRKLKPPGRPEWNTWANEQLELSRRVADTETYKLLLKECQPGTEITGGMSLTLAHTRVHVSLPPGELDPAIPDASLPESPACYYHHLCLAACEWASLNLASRPMRDVNLPGIEKLPRTLAIMRDENLSSKLAIKRGCPRAELRYKVLRLATELTSEENPDRWDYSAERARTKEVYQIPMPLLKEIKRQHDVAFSTAKDMLKDMGFVYPPKLLVTISES